MSRSTAILLRMALFVLLISIGCLFLLPALSAAFHANVVINGVILGALLIGMIHAFRTVALLKRESDWIERFKRQMREGGALLPQDMSRMPRLLASAATLLSERSSRTGQLWLSADSMRTILDGIATRIDESRETGRYMVGLLVFLGLLGTFWGLLETVRAIADVIAGLDVTGGDMGAAFGELKLGLQAPLSGMGTAFSSSLFGLAGSLILGFLGLQAGQAQNRFYNDLEEWLSGLTRLSGSALGGSDGGQPVPAFIQALLEQTAESLEQLQRITARAEENRAATSGDIGALAGRLSEFTAAMKIEQDLLLKLAESQMELKSALAGMARSGGMERDEALLRHMQNVETLFARLPGELAKGREELVGEMRREIRLLARTLEAVMRGG